MIAEVAGIELKDCPFCGSVATLRTQNSPYTHIYYWAKCSNKDCNVSTISTRDPQQAQALWNNRA